jgi:hypothetical protein
MQDVIDMPYWMRSIGRHLRGQCTASRELPFVVKLNVLHLVRMEGEMRLFQAYPSLF